jgi:hypothetical protein
MTIGPMDGNKAGALIQSMFARMKVCGFGGGRKPGHRISCPSVMRDGARVNSAAGCSRIQLSRRMAQKVLGRRQDHPVSGLIAG